MDPKRQEYIRGLCMMDDLLMSVVLQNKDCAQLVLRIILEDPGLEVKEVHTYQELAAENRRLKETEEGAKQMESVVDRIFVEGREEGRMEGYAELLEKLVKAGDLSPEKATKYAGIAREQSLGLGK